MQQPVVSKGRSRLQLILIALLFGGPLLLAAVLYQTGAWQPAGRTNNGAMLEPIVSLNEVLSEIELTDLTADGWLLVYPNDGQCAENCAQALVRLRQTRLMLGNEMTRIRRIFLHGEMLPDRVHLDAEHAGLKTLQETSLMKLLAENRPANLATGGMYLVDPLGNLVMYFSPDIEPGDMVDDIKHLLELSRIG